MHTVQEVESPFFTEEKRKLRGGTIRTIEFCCKHRFLSVGLPYQYRVWDFFPQVLPIPVQVAGSINFDTWYTWEALANGGPPTKITLVVILSCGKTVKGGGNKCIFRFCIMLYLFQFEFRDTVLIVIRGKLYCNFIVLVSHCLASGECNFKVKE